MQYEIPPSARRGGSRHSRDHKPLGRTRAIRTAAVKNRAIIENPQKVSPCRSDALKARHKTPPNSNTVAAYRTLTLELIRFLQRESRSASAAKTPIARASALMGVATNSAACMDVHRDAAARKRGESRTIASSACANRRLDRWRTARGISR